MSNVDDNVTPAEEGETFVDTPVAVLVAVACALAALVISSYHIATHLISFSKPELQKYIVRIILIVPMLAMFSCIAMMLPPARFWVMCLYDVWEALVIYSFLMLILQYCGGENECAQAIAVNPGSVPHIWPLNYCTKPIQTTGNFLNNCKRLTLQLVLLKPVMVLVSIILFFTGDLEGLGWLISSEIIYNLSYAVALYGLTLFYLATKNLPAMKDKSPVTKFVALKFVIFLIFWQGVVIRCLPITGPEKLLWKDFLVCCESLAFSIVHFFAYSVTEFRPAPSLPASKRVEAVGAKGVTPTDPNATVPPAPRVAEVLTDGADLEKGGEKGKKAVAGTTAFKPSETENTKERRKASATPKAVLSNIGAAMNVGDVFADAIQSYQGRYHSHVKLDDNGKESGASAGAEGKQGGSPKSQKSSEESVSSKVSAHAAASAAAARGNLNASGMSRGEPDPEA